MLCASCGAENPEEAKFCNACGNTVAEVETAKAETDNTAVVPAAADDALENADAALTAPGEHENPETAAIVEPEAESPAAGDPVAGAEAAEEADALDIPPELPVSAPPEVHPKFAPPSLEQEVALVEGEKLYPWVSVPVGLSSFVVLLLLLGWADSRGTYFIPVSIVGAAAIYLATQFVLLPLFRPSIVRCPHCGKDVPQAKEALPRTLWPWACPHCRKPLVTPGS